MEQKFFEFDKEVLKENLNRNAVDWKKELKKCALDTTRAYMIEKYVFKSPLWKGQKELLGCTKHRHVTFSTKSRAVGYTTLMAALVACEMVLNCDVENSDMVYISHTEQDKRIFQKKVIEYINAIPKELWTTDSLELIVSKNRSITLGKSKVILECAGDGQPTRYNYEEPKYAIYDEMVRTKDNFDFNDPNEHYWFVKSDKVIIGGCPNHMNEKYFDFAKAYKEKYGSFVKMQWSDNPLHTSEDYQLRKTWASDIHAFSSEFDCEIFKLKKETL